VVIKLHAFLPWQDMKMNSQLNAPGALSPGEKNSTHWTEAQVGPRPGLNTVARKKYFSLTGN